MELLASVCVFVCLSMLFRLNSLTYNLHYNQVLSKNDHYQSKEFLCVSVLSAYGRYADDIVDVIDSPKSNAIDKQAIH